MGIAWDTSFTTDATFAALTPAGLVPTGKDQVGDLIQQSGKVATQVLFLITSRIVNQKFDPGRVWVSWLVDIDGVNHEDPSQDLTDVASYHSRQATGSKALVPIGVTGSPDTANYGTSQSKTTKYNSTLIVYSSQAAGFRFYCRNETGIDLLFTVKYKQA